MTVHPLTGFPLVEALSGLSLAPQTQPEFLRDALRMKRNRGDADANQFKAVACREFAVKLNATISGARYAMEQWLRKGVLTSTGEREAFLSDLDAILAGDRKGWDIGRAA